MSTALHLAATNGHTEVIELLMKANADVNFRNNVHVPLIQTAADDTRFVTVRQKWSSSSLMLWQLRRCECVVGS